MGLQLYNVRTRKKEPFVPLRADGPIGMYVCGLTVYDHMHIGHARTAVSFEVIRRWMEHRYPQRGVRFVQNVTDVDDKILARAKEQGISPREHAAKWDRICIDAARKLGVRVPEGADHPHVTQSVPDIIRFIEGILANKLAYATPDGNVYFDVPAYDAQAETRYAGCGYGSLSNRDYREMAAGTRKEVETDKKHPADFALWKSADAGDHPDANWPSPWGSGRPGWHIECSLMATRALGEQIDIHGGGQDLIFPHHENEIAQSQAKTGKAPFVNVWMHAGFLNVEGEKMSKSLGNFVTLEDALAKMAAQNRESHVLRFYFLQTHYRSKIDFTEQGVEEAHQGWLKLEQFLRRLHTILDEGVEHGSGDAKVVEFAAAAQVAVATAMDDDIHTPAAVAALFENIRRANPFVASDSIGKEGARRILAVWAEIGHCLNLPLEKRPVGRAFLGAVMGTVPAPKVLLDEAIRLGIEPHPELLELVRRFNAARAVAKETKDWKTADAIRQAAKLAGFAIEDTPNGPRWNG